MHQRVVGLLIFAVAGGLFFYALPAATGDVRWLGLGVSLLAAMGCVYYWLTGGGTVFVLSRAFVALVPVAVIAVFLTLAVAQGEDPTENRILIAAIVVAGGWIVGFVTQELRRLDERLEKRRDLTKALRAEVQAIVELNRKFDWEEAIAEARKDFAGDEDFVPFLLYFHETDVLRRVVAEIDILRNEQIEEVYAFFHLMHKIRQIAERLEGKNYRELPARRRQTVYIRLLRLHGEIVDTGVRALSALDKEPFGGVVQWRD
ncbi:MAG: hypothetical protein AAFP13_07015 [Pseudomonadota bacterium]